MSPELREDILHAEATRSETAKTTIAAASAETLRTHRMTELIITGSLVGIAQNIISLRSLLEFLFGILVSGITSG